MKKPFLIWFSLACCALLALAATSGLLRLLPLADTALADPHLRGRFLLALIVQISLAGYLVLVLYGLLARPRWGRGIAISFAVVLTATMAWTAFHPDPHPLLPIKPGEQGGAVAGRALMVLLSLFYAYKMALSSDPVRRYFDPLPPRRLGAVAEPDDDVASSGTD